MKNKYLRLHLTIILKTLTTTAIVIMIVAILLAAVDYFTVVYNGEATIVNVFATEDLNTEISTKIYNMYLQERSYILFITGVFSFISSYICFATITMNKSMNKITTALQQVNTDLNSPTTLMPGMEVIEDIINKKKIELNDLEVRNKESSRRQSEIIMFLAHDLKTPLTSIVAYLTMLQMEKKLTIEEKKRCIDTALDKSHRLGELINEFFEITKYNLQAITLELEVFDVGLMMEQMAEEYYGLMAEKNLKCEVGASEGLYINGDCDKLGRVFENILRNAVNYCRPSSKITMTAEEVGCYVEICIANEGDQIPEEKLFTIFEKFYRLDDARSSETGGSGLGLAISKEIMDLHNGQLFAESNPNQTSFIIRIPKYDKSNN